MDSIYIVLGLIASVFGALILAYSKGRSSASIDKEVEKLHDDLERALQFEKTKSNIKEVIAKQESETNAKDRSALIKSLSTDSLRSAEQD